MVSRGYSCSTRASHLKPLADNASDLLLGGKKGDSCVLHEKATTASATEAVN
jgi:hypothetical protein